MKPQYKFVVKIWSISLALSLATSWASNTANSPELVLAIRLLGSAFFFGLYLHVSKIIKKQTDMIKASGGFKEMLFDPNYLKITLILCIMGWTTFSVLQYVGFNPIDWITIFILGVVVFPFAMNKIPLRMPREDWRHRHR